jgi:hypothetical protein
MHQCAKVFATHAHDAHSAAASSSGNGNNRGIVMS